MNSRNGLKEENGKKGTRHAGTGLLLVALVLTLSRCATMFAQKVVAQGGPEPEWVTTPTAPPGHYAFGGEGYDLDHLKTAQYKACAQAEHRAGDRRDASGKLHGLAVHSWWKRTEGVVGKRFHAYCEILTK